MVVDYRDYQKNIIQEGKGILDKYRFLYLAMQVRTGKTLTSLGIAAELGCDRVLFITKKKAISSIEDDYSLFNKVLKFELTVINYESLHKLPKPGNYDLIICDEAHTMGAFPKPSKRAKQVKDLISACSHSSSPYVILLSGTPSPESYSNLYHQVYGVPTNPFKGFKNFFKFAAEYIDVQPYPFKIQGYVVKNYGGGLLKILDALKPYTISYTQREAGFKVELTEHVEYVKMKPIIYELTKKLKKDLVIEGKNEVVLADIPIKLMMKLHQMFSGSVKFESGKSIILDKSKGEYIYNKFKDKKIGIFYKFKEELNILKEVYGDQLCTELVDFNETNKSIALQIVSGREGISLRKASALVYFNIDFSATSYWQSRDRMTTKERLKSDVYWIFSEGGIEKDIYKAVTKKKDYTLKHFKQDNK